MNQNYSNTEIHSFNEFTKIKNIKEDTNQQNDLNSTQINYLNIGVTNFQNNNTINSFSNNNYIPLKINDSIDQNIKKNSNKSLNFNQIYHQKKEYSYNSYSLKELFDKSYIICRNQSGCRYLEKTIDENPKFASMIFSLIKDKINELMFDPFGNYFIQKIIEYLNLNQINEILKNGINNNFLEICLNPHGTRVIQKIIEKIYNNNVSLDLFNMLLFPHLSKIILDQNSTHIIIKYMNLIHYPKNKNIFSFIHKNIYNLATHKHSVCTLQKTIESLDNQQRKILLMDLAQISQKLFNDQFGNYVVQFVLSKNEKEVNKIIINYYLSDLIKNACRKFSSNVFEKLFEYCCKEIKQMVIKNICNYSNVRILLYDIYGNYILQQIVKEASEPYKNYYIELIGSLIDGLKIFPYGNIIFQKFISNFPELLNFVNINSNIVNNNISNFIYYHHSFNNIGNNNSNILLTKKK